MSGSTTEADDWEGHWAEYTIAAERNPAQQYRRKLILDLLRWHGCRHGSRIVDIGSGQGDLAADICAQFPEANVLGIELSARGVEIAQKKVPGALFHQQDLLDSTAPPRGFVQWAQFATCSEVLEHIDYPKRLLSAATEYLANDCWLVVTVPGGPLSAFDTHIGHRQHFTESSITRLLEDCGFQDVRAIRAGFPFFNLYRLIVILRGRRLMDDVATSPGQDLGWLARVMMGVFRFLFHANAPRSPWGWQIVATGRWSRSAAHQSVQQPEK